MNAAAAAKTAARRRLAACVVVAGALHAVVLGGLHAVVPDRIDFTVPPAQARAIELTLVGNMLVPVAEPAEEVPEPVSEALPSAEPPAPKQTATLPDTVPSLAAPPARPAAPQPSPLAGRSVVDLARAVAAAAEAGRGQPDAAASRVRRLSESAPGPPEFAFYLASWRREVERIGQLNYPRAAAGGKLTGSLRLLATIAADGTLVAARVIESSGHPELDAAAVRIVHLAAPYAPFTPRMRESVDQLEIDRTWRFLRRGVQ